MRGILNISLLGIFSCTSKDIPIEEISFLHNNSNAQTSLVSNNGSLSLSKFEKLLFSYSGKSFSIISEG